MIKKVNNKIKIEIFINKEPKIDKSLDKVYRLLYKCLYINIEDRYNKTNYSFKRISHFHNMATMTTIECKQCKQKTTC